MHSSSDATAAKGDEAVLHGGTHRTAFSGAQIIRNLRVARGVHAGRSAGKAKIGDLKKDFLGFPEQWRIARGRVAPGVRVARNASVKGRDAPGPRARIRVGKHMEQRPLQFATDRYNAAEVCAPVVAHGDGHFLGQRGAHLVAYFDLVKVQGARVRHQRTRRGAPTP